MSDERMFTLDRFTAILHQRYEAIVRVNRSVATEQTRIAARVLAAAAAGVVHNAASEDTLQSEALRSELLELIDSYRSARPKRRRAAAKQG